MCLWWKHRENLDPERGAVRKASGCISALSYPKLQVKCISFIPYMNSVSLPGFAAALWALPGALSSLPAVLPGSREARCRCPHHLQCCSAGLWAPQPQVMFPPPIHFDTSELTAMISLQLVSAGEKVNTHRVKITHLQNLKCLN